MPILITAGLSPEAWRLQRLLNVKDAVFTDETKLPDIPGIISIVLPASNSISYIHETLKACLDYNINCVYPLKWDEIIGLSKARALYSEYNISLMIPSDNWLENNAERSVVRTGNITILQNGDLKTGDMPSEDIFPDGETGIFSWATDGQKIEYSLYII